MTSWVRLSSQQMFRFYSRIWTLEIHESSIILKISLIKCLLFISPFAKFDEGFHTSLLWDKQMGNPERILRQFSRQNSTGFYICLRVQIGERQKFCHQYCRNFDCSKTTGRIERTACGLAWTAGNDRAGMAAFGWWRLRLWATIYGRFFMRRLRDFMR